MAADEYFPDEQVEQLVEKKVEVFEAAQRLQEGEPEEAANVPASQPVHVPDPELEVVPAVQAAQPSALLFPAAPGLGWLNPASHSLQDAEPMPEYLPARQFWQFATVEDLTLVEYLPAKQSVQDATPVEL